MLSSTDDGPNDYLWFCISAAIRLMRKIAAFIFLWITMDNYFGENGSKKIRISIGRGCMESLPCQHYYEIYINDVPVKGKTANAREIANDWKKYMPNLQIPQHFARYG